MKNANTPKNGKGSATTANDTPLQPIKKPFDPSRDIVPPEVMEIARNDAERMDIILRTGQPIHRFNQGKFGLRNKSVHSMVSSYEREYKIPVMRCPAGIRYAPTAKKYYLSKRTRWAFQLSDEGNTYFLDRIKERHLRRMRKRAVATMTKKAATFISEVETDPEVLKLCPDLLEFLLEVGDRIVEIERKQRLSGEGK